MWSHMSGTAWMVMLPVMVIVIAGAIAVFVYVVNTLPDAHEQRSRDLSDQRRDAPRHRGGT